MLLLAAGIRCGLRVDLFPGFTCATCHSAERSSKTCRLLKDKRQNESGSSFNNRPEIVAGMPDRQGGFEEHPGGNSEAGQKWV